MNTDGNGLIGKRVTIGRVAGRARRAVLFDGTQITRTSDDIIQIVMEGGRVKNVKTAPYDNHFCYNTPKHIIGWSPMCTCGSPAGIVGYNAYKQDASPTGGDGKFLVPGEMVVCLHHAESGKHADGSS